MAGSKRILIIEDDQFISDMYARVLTKSGYEVDFATEGNNGVAKAKDGKFDVILLDIMMPGKTGIDVLRELRGADGKGLPESKIIILTNLAQDKSSKEALEAQADGYLIKADVVPSKLVKIIEQLG